MAAFDRKPGGVSLVQETPARGNAVPGKRTLVEQLADTTSVQRAQRRTVIANDDPAGIRAAAARGTSGPSGALPHLDAIQRSFGRHDVSRLQAHVGGAAAHGAGDMAAKAFAVGNHVAFASAPSLHTAAHEAAHAVQQRGGVQLFGGVGQVSDKYEQHADAVADLVVQGRSSEALLDRYGDPAGETPHAATSTVQPVQRLVAVAGGQVSASSLDAIKDPTILTSIDYALSRTSGPVVLLREADFSQVKDGETIFITGHGSQGSVTGMTGAQIAGYLTKGAKALRTDIKNVTVFFLSCYAGSDQFAPGTSGKEKEPDSSVIAKLSAGLAQSHPGVRVIGGVGPTVKANATGDQFNVIKEPGGTTNVRETLDDTPDLNRDELENKYNDWLQKERERRHNEQQQPEEPPIELRAAKAAEIYRERAQAFLQLHKERKLVYNTEDPEERRRMLRMYLNGQEVPYDEGFEAFIGQLLATSNS